MPAADRRPAQQGGKGGWEERHTALLELAATLFCTALLRKQQDRIAKAVVCYGEALRVWREVVPNARDDPDSFHLFKTSVGCMPPSRTIRFV